MMVITLSRQLGSGGDEIASRVAEVLDLDLVDHARLRRAAVAAGVSELAWEELELIGRGDLVEQLTKALRSVPPTPTSERELFPILTPRAGPLDGIFAPPLPPASIALAESVRILEDVVNRLADTGRVLIIGGGGQAILANRPGVLHVSIIAPFEQRVTTVQRREGISLAEARRKVRASDRNRAEYLRRFYDVHWDDPALYHLTLNTGRLSRAVAAAAIIAAARAMAAGS
ncbi:MAG TPA: cytidylate kinase-like family protein [Caldilineae bacterium]|nr:cytidylate kinase-like family protein [Caldilineae bacterium]